MRWSYRAGSFAGWFGLWIAAGCNTAPPPPPIPDTVPFTGVVTLDGVPLPGALVTFLPKSDDNALPATGLTNDSGEYTLSVRVGQVVKPGALPGEYKVTIQSGMAPPVKGVEAPPPGAPLPMQYTEPAKTKLTATISSEGGSQDFSAKSK